MQNQPRFDSLSSQSSYGGTNLNNKTKLIGVVTVDSARVVIGDPCCVDVAQAQEADDYNPAGGQLGGCVMAPNFGGDGIFPVYATYTDSADPGRGGSPGDCLESITIYFKRRGEDGHWTPEQLEGKEFWDEHGRRYVREQHELTTRTSAQ